MLARPLAPVRWFLAVAVAVFAVAFGRADDRTPPNPWVVPTRTAEPAKKPAGYPFAKSPLEAFDELDKEFGLSVRLTAEERRLIRKVWACRVSGTRLDLTDAEQIDLFLMVSGVTDADARKKYHRKIAALRDDCGDELNGLTRPADRGERVFRFVRSALPEGFRSGQTRLSVALDDGTFNCVSVSMLLYLVGTHHGLDLRPMLCPGHAYLEWVPGSGSPRAVVEGTNPDGFRYVEKMSPEERKLNRDDLDSYAHGREVDAAGLAGSTYANRGCYLTGARRPDRPAIVGLYLTALALDPARSEVAAELEKELVAWADEVAQDGVKGCEKALSLIQVAKGIAPAGRLVIKKESDLRMLLWAYAVDDGDTRKMAERAEQAAAALPDDPRFKTQSTMYAWIAFNVYAATGKWDSAMALLDLGLTRANSNADREYLWDQKAEMFRQWSAALVKSGDLAGSLEVLAKAVKAAPHHPATATAVAHHADAAAKHPKASVHLKKLRERFPTLADTPAPARTTGRAG